MFSLSLRRWKRQGKQASSALFFFSSQILGARGGPSPSQVEATLCCLDKEGDLKFRKQFPADNFPPSRIHSLTLKNEQWIALRQQQKEAAGLPLSRVFSSSFLPSLVFAQKWQKQELAGFFSFLGAALRGASQEISLQAAKRGTGKAGEGAYMRVGASWSNNVDLGFRYWCSANCFWLGCTAVRKHTAYSIGYLTSISSHMTEIASKKNRSELLAPSVTTWHIAL